MYKIEPRGTLCADKKAPKISNTSAHLNLNSSKSQEVRNRLEIDFMYLDLNVCGRCQGTDSGLDEAVADC